MTTYQPPKDLWTPAVYIGAVLPGTYLIRNVGSNAALDLKDSNAAAGTPIINSQVTKNHNQKWVLESGVKGYNIKNGMTGTYLSFATGVPSVKGSPVSGNGAAIEWEVITEGTNYKIRLASDTSLVLDLADGNKANGNVVISPNNGAASQSWILEQTSISISAGVYWIRNAHSKAALDLMGFNLAPGTPVINYPVNKGNNQKWILEQGASGFKIKNCATNAYLSIASNLPATQYRNVSCNPHSMEWDVIKEGSNYSIRVSANKDLALDLAGGITSDCNAIILWPYHGGITEQWIFEVVPPYVGAKPPGTYYIQSAMPSNPALDLWGGNSAPGTTIAIYQTHKGPNQKWILESGINGYRIKNAQTGTYLGFANGVAAAENSAISGNQTPVEWEIVSKDKNFIIRLASNTNLVLDLYAGQTNNGTKVMTYTLHGNLNQQWVLTPA